MNHFFAPRRPATRDASPAGWSRAACRAHRSDASSAWPCPPLRPMPWRRPARGVGWRALSCAPTGPLARVALPAAPADAVATARRAAAAAPTACAVALSGPRDADLDALLALQDAVVLVARAGADSTLVRLALAGLTAMGPPATAVAPPTGISRRLGLAGVAVLPRLRAEIGDALA